jgi:hypothetical protein
MPDLGDGVDVELAGDATVRRSVVLDPTRFGGDQLPSPAR